jgi:hypothetical protein
MAKLIYENGRLYRIEPLQTYPREDGTSFRRQNFILQTSNGQSLSYVKLEATQETIDELAAFQEGAAITVSYFVKAREVKKGKYMGQFFNDVVAMHIDAWTGGGVPEPQQQPAPAPAPESTTVQRVMFDANGETTDDDLPF